MPNLDTFRTPVRIGSCRCGRLTARCEGEPVRISVCHCLDCKQRSGSAFAAQARWPTEKVTLTGDPTDWSYTGESGSTAIFSFCPNCGSPAWYVVDSMPGVIAIPTGAFTDPTFPAPQYSVWEERKHDWVEITGEGVERYD